RADANGDGAMTREEFEKVRQKFGPGQPPRAQDASAAQTEGAPAAAQSAGPDPGRIWQRLLMADKDGDGRLTAEEAPERMKRNFERVDTNKDGFVDESEFKSSVARMRAALSKKES